MMRWLVLFFIFLGIGALGIISLVPMRVREVQSSALKLGLPSPKPPSPSLRAFVVEELIATGVFHGHAMASFPKEVTPEEAIEEAVHKLPKGEIYHNVPEEMEVGIQETIEAGVAPEVTEKIKKELQGKGKINIESGVQYDPSGVEMKLVVAPDEFKVLDVEGGKQFISSVTPGKWVWRVTPLKAGDNLIVVKAVVDLNVPQLKITRPVEFETFSVTRKVRVNLVYSSSQFVSSNWKEVLGLLIGSGSLASLVTWWIGRRDKIKSEGASQA